MSPASAWPHAALLGVAGGMRTFMPPAAVVLRGGLTRGRGRYVVLAAAAGELLGDKHPSIPARVLPPALAGRMVSSGVAGRSVAGSPGVAAAAGAALMTGLASYRARATIASRTGTPDAWFGAAEDVVSASLAALATHPPPDARRAAPAGVEASSAQDEDTAPGRSHSRLGAAVRGLAAGAVGTAAMTVAQAAHRQAFGSRPSSAPAQAGRRIIRAALGRRVPRKRMGELNQAMHWLYGTSWGVPYGLIAGSGQRRPAVEGAALGLGVWAVSLVQLPAMGLAPPVWEYAPRDLAGDVVFHLVYGLGAAGAFSALP